MTKDIWVRFFGHVCAENLLIPHIVTIQEAAWESFSEDEAPPPAATKPTPASTPAASSTQKSKKAAPGKSASQGSIMSFFAKK